MFKTPRYLSAPISVDLKKKMVFLGGPRQVGKTTLSQSYLKPKNRGYFNWDVTADRRSIMADEIPDKEPLLIFDEIHKYKNWRQFIKGHYDKNPGKSKILVTGSARLDHFRKGGDSLVGRYHYFRLHPFSLCELSKTPSASDLKTLLTFGGFPEPLFAGRETAWRRWQRERVSRVINDDLRDLQIIREISLIDLLVESLPDRVGSPLSLQNLAEDLQVSQPSVGKWIELLDNVYMTFRISPYGAPRIRAVKKEQKLYFWDWTQASAAGARFENLVASHLLKYCHFIEDTEGYKMELRFLRDTDKREIDFVVLKDKKPLFAVECKTGDRQLSPHINYFSQRTAIPAFYQVHMGYKDFGSAKTGRVLPFSKFCSEIGIP